MDGVCMLAGAVDSAFAAARVAAADEAAFGPNWGGGQSPHRPSPHHPLLDPHIPTTPCTTYAYNRRLGHPHRCRARVAGTDAAEIEHKLRLGGMLTTC